MLATPNIFDSCFSKYDTWYESRLDLSRNLKGLLPFWKVYFPFERSTSLLKDILPLLRLPFYELYPNIHPLANFWSNLCDFWPLVTCPLGVSHISIFPIFSVIWTLKSRWVNLCNAKKINKVKIFIYVVNLNKSFQKEEKL